jgi:hypothetical protein
VISKISVLGRMYLLERSSLEKQIMVPVLVWASVAKTDSKIDPFVTHAGDQKRSPTVQDPVCFTLEKAGSRANAFTMGITVGRTENNDIPINDPSVSRFHAYFQQDPNRRWKVADAESRNGTFLGAKRLAPNVGSYLGDKDEIKFGDVVVTFLEPASFFQYLITLAQ